MRIRDSDERLLASNFFAARADTWFGPDTHSERRTLIEADDFDVTLTKREAQTLRQLLDKLASSGRGPVSHGWFDVVEVHTSYEPFFARVDAAPGVEYRAEMSDGKHVTVAYARMPCESCLWEPGFVDAPHMQLTDKQHDTLESVLRVHDVVQHGWFMRA